jgi:hypothetical protein
MVHFQIFLSENGVQVTAIDTQDAPLLDEAVTFEKIRFEEFETEEKFDLVHARNVVPFFENKTEQVRRMLRMGKYVFFTFFGPKDPWERLTISKEEMLTALTAGAEILYLGEEEYIGKKMDGSMKPWHLFTVVVKTKDN